ncbi:3-deoxy-D-manno-octulosonic acid transferase [Sediminicoccus sp. KRV36]|uniref:3-deoxy-D-manno-octulosonic acid transferase n=1 Tax=Sediminicoccus sp. KRV36 TaxID=3133721 RepID=UPI00200E63E6|nr:3-deoxy-D-manno-octulosonic acid transferase [Sediminicoccus rosea]UPY37424.1 3-deoxy-D-manno-octulosonic acid transferase [Sediminicoccus rosea]
MSGAWHHLAGLAAPALRWNLRRRVARDKEDPARLAEREGHGAARPPGRLIWLHAASVGESLAILPLMEALAARDPALTMLVTTGTVTSARLLPQRLPDALRGRVLHRYAPLDVPAWVARFLDGWRPDAAGFVESELWPNTLAATHGRGIPLALLNARISDRTAARWGRWAPGFARDLLGRFRLIMPRSAQDAARLQALGAQGLTPPGDLKLAAPPLPVDAAALTELRGAIGGRPVLLAASTHPGEEAQIMAAAAELRGSWPQLLTILAPRHPERGAELGEAPRRSLGQGPDAGPLYIADTMGEMGLLYRAADIAFIGGSLVPHGGQNPLEAARLGCPMIFGPHMENFQEASGGLLAAGGARQVQDAAALAATMADMLTHPDASAAMARAAGAWVSSASDLPGRMAEALLALVGPDGAVEKA